MRSFSTSEKVALAVSVPVVAVCVYLIVKWAQQDEKDLENVEQFASSSQSYTVEIKIPQSLVGVIIGRAGCNVKKIQKDTGTRINLVDDPESDNEKTDIVEENAFDNLTTIKEKERSLVIKGTRENAKEAELIIRKIISEQPCIESEVFEIPLNCVGRVIGKAGKNIRQICRISGAKLKIDDDDNRKLDKKLCLIKGSRSQIEYAKKLIEEKINDDLYYKKKNVSQDGAISRVMLPSHGDFFGVYVSAMVNPGQFWIQLVNEDSKILDQLIDDMTSCYGADSSSNDGELTQVNVGDLCAVPFKHDQSWYRAQITKLVSDTHIEVFYGDFGDSGVVPLNNVKKLRTEHCRLPFQAVKCCLFNVQPKDEEWTKKACHLFEKLSYCAEWKVIMARIVNEHEDCLTIELIDTNSDKDVNIARELVSNEVAKNIKCEMDEDIQSGDVKDIKQARITDEVVMRTKEEMIETQPQYNFNQQSWRTANTSSSYEVLQFDSSSDDDDHQYHTMTSSGDNQRGGNINQQVVNHQQIIGEQTFVMKDSDKPKICTTTTTMSPDVDTSQNEAITTTATATTPSTITEDTTTTISPLVVTSQNEAKTTTATATTPSTITEDATITISPLVGTSQNEAKTTTTTTTTTIPHEDTDTMSQAETDKDLNFVPDAIKQDDGTLKMASISDTIQNQPLPTTTLSSTIDEDTSDSTTTPTTGKNTSQIDETMTTHNHTGQSTIQQDTAVISGDFISDDNGTTGNHRGTTTTSLDTSIEPATTDQRVTNINHSTDQATINQDDTRTEDGYTNSNQPTTTSNGGSEDHGTRMSQIDEPMITMTEQTLVSCVDVNQLPPLDDMVDEEQQKTITDGASDKHITYSSSNKRVLAPNFGHFINVKQDSDIEDDETEDDDESLYLSAIEDSDSTGFLSAQGSVLDLHNVDDGGEVTPSGYLSDAEDEDTKLDDTLLAEKLQDFLSDE